MHKFHLDQECHNTEKLDSSYQSFRVLFLEDLLKYYSKDWKNMQFWVPWRSHPLSVYSSTVQWHETATSLTQWIGTNKYIFKIHLRHVR